MPTNTKESGLEDIIANSLMQDNGYEQGGNEDFNRDYAIMELYKQYADNPSFRLWLIDMIFNGTYKRKEVRSQ